MPFAILVVWTNGEEGYLMEGNRIATFHSRSRADEQVDFMRMGMDLDDVQSISVVTRPGRGRGARR